MADISRQSAALARAAGRELIWGLRDVSREVSSWRALALSIPDPGLRADALRALDRKRGNIDGAALFWTLPDRRDRKLLHALVAWEVLADYLDCVSERGASLGIANGRQLHLALTEALQPDLQTPDSPQPALSDYYLHHSCKEDGGYLHALVRTCRHNCAQLPSYERTAPLLRRAAALAGHVLGINHEPDERRRDLALQEWAAQQLPYPTGQSWFERTAGASAWVTVHAMLALAAQPGHEPDWSDRQTYAAYLQWIAPVGAMLDSYGDIAEDRANTHHSYIAHYPSVDVAVERICELVRRSRTEADALPEGSRHGLITSCMIAFYLSKDTVHTPAMRQGTKALLDAGGPQVRLLLPLLRIWRVANGQRAA